jgi:hypothetical protein
MRVCVLALLVLAVTPGSGRAAEPVAVVELFTSEGCSSCPPADRLLSRIAAEPPARDGRVVCLAYHVDYWNQLGWPDRFSDPAFSVRQRGYAESLGEARVFTPQAVVNGDVSVVGSDERALRTAIANALQHPAAAELVLAVGPGDRPGELRVEVRAGGRPIPGVFQVAVVEDGLETRVERGENGGRALRHDCVVRTFTSSPAGDRAVTVRLTVPPDLAASRSRVVALLQDPGTLRILGAASAPVD